MYEMSTEHDVQRKLRDELQSVPTDSPNDTELDRLPYLDAVVRETLRLHCPVYGTEREAVQDDVVPLKTPYLGTDGVLHHEILCVYHRLPTLQWFIKHLLLRRISKGDGLAIPIMTMNRSVDFWGDDAHEFRYVSSLPTPTMPS